MISVKDDGRTSVEIKCAEGGLSLYRGHKGILVSVQGPRGGKRGDTLEIDLDDLVTAVSTMIDQELGLIESARLPSRYLDSRGQPGMCKACGQNSNDIHSVRFSIEGWNSVHLCPRCRQSLVNFLGFLANRKAQKPVKRPLSEGNDNWLLRRVDNQQQAIEEETAKINRQLLL